MLELIARLAPPSGAGSPNPLAPIFFMGLIFFAFYFLLLRPQKKKEDQRKKMITELKKGDNVVTIGGMFGKVTQVKDDSVLLQVDDNTKVRVDKNAITSLRTQA